MIDEAIILMAPDAELSDEQIVRMEGDDRLNEACQDIFLASNILAHEHEPKPDVEAALKRFHQKNNMTTDIPKENKRHLRPLWISLAAAAIIATVFLLFHPQKPPIDEDLVFCAEESKSGVMVHTANGKAVPVKVIKSKERPDVSIAIDKQLLQLDEQLVVALPQGNSYCMKLPDGSRVWLHPGSRLVYPNSFQYCREVSLSGEAYFSVVHDPDHPFVVKTAQGTIRDYGTEFNISTRHEVTEVVLIEGSVDVASVNGGEQMLSPGEKCTLSEEQLSMEEVATDPYISWRDGYIHFEKSTLNDILCELGRYYNLNVVCSHPELLNYHMRFIIPRGQPAAYAVQMLNRMEKVSVRLQGNKIIVE